jgi:xanthine/CO dehydrogenase XdhC/CoxF family maturation factor
MKELQQILTALKSAPAGDAVLATLVKVEGSSYRRPGARLLLLADGRRLGSISGGCLEDDVITHAREVLANGTAKTITYDTTTENDLVWGVGLGCHGVVHVLIEKLPSQPRWADALRENFRRRMATELAVLWRESVGTPLGTYLASDLPPAPIGVEPAVPAGSSPPGRRAPPSIAMPASGRARRGAGRGQPCRADQWRGPTPSVWLAAIAQKNSRPAGAPPGFPRGRL